MARFMNEQTGLHVIADFMEGCGELALSRVVYKPMCWFCYFNNMFMIWTHGAYDYDEVLSGYQLGQMVER
jgi:hypothetical protein